MVFIIGVSNNHNVVVIEKGNFMKKTTAFYVAGAALAATYFVAAEEASASELVAETGYTFLEGKNVAQPIDLKKDGTIRTIEFSLPVDAETVKENENITLYDVTAKKEMLIEVRVEVSGLRAFILLQEGYTYEEGHEYRLLIGKTIQNKVTRPTTTQKVMSLQQAVQFNFKIAKAALPELTEEEKVLLPFSKLERQQQHPGARRLKLDVTPEDITSAYEEAKTLAKTDEHKALVETYYENFQYFYVMKELLKLSKIDNVYTSTFTPLKEDVTKEQLEAIFATFPSVSGEYARQYNDVKVLAFGSLQVAELFEYVDYVPNPSIYSYVLKEGKTLEDFLRVIEKLIADEATYDVGGVLDRILREVVKHDFEDLYVDYVLREDVTRAEIDSIYHAQMEEAEGMEAANDVQEQYRDVLYDYYEGKLMPYVLYKETYNNNEMIHLVPNTTPAQIEAVFADWSEEDIELPSVSNMKTYALASIEVASVLALLNENYGKLQGTKRLASGDVATIMKQIDTVQRETLNETAQKWLQAQYDYFKEAAFLDLLNDDGRTMRDGVTLADIEQAKEVSKPYFDERMQNYMYREYEYYYYLRETLPLFVEKTMNQPPISLLKDDVTKEQLDAIFAEWEEGHNEYYYKDFTDELRNVLYNSLELRDMLKLFKTDYKKFDGLEQLVDGATIEQVRAAYEKASKSSNSDVVSFAQNLVTGLVEHYFEPFYRTSYEGNFDRLQDDVTLEDIQKATVASTEHFSNWRIQALSDKAYFYYYFREMHRLLGITDSLSRPVVLTKKATIAQINDVFASWSKGPFNTSYSSDIESLQKYSIMSVQLHELYSLLHVQYTYKAQPVFAEGVTIEQFIKTYNTVKESTNDAEMIRQLESLQHQIMAGLFWRLENDNWTYGAERLKADVTFEQIQALYNSLLPLAKKSALDSILAEYSSFYYDREADKLAPGITEPKPLVKLAPNVTLQHIEALFATFDETSKHEYAGSIRNLKQKLLNAYNLSSFTTLLKDTYERDVESPFKDDVTTAELQKQYEAITDDALREIAAAVISVHANYIFSQVGSYPSNGTSELIFEMHKTAKPAQITAAYDELVAIDQFIDDELLTRYVNDLAPFVPARTASATSIEALATYAAVAPFIQKSEYGYTIDEAANRDALEAFADELATRQDEASRVLLEQVRDVLAKPVAFKPIYMS